MVNRLQVQMQYLSKRLLTEIQNFPNIRQITY